jgi:hypothetical protein
MAESLRQKNLIHSAALSLQGYVGVVAPENGFCTDGLVRPSTSAVHLPSEFVGGTSSHA